MRNARVSLLACGFVYALIAGPPEARAAADLGTRCQARKLALAGTYANRALQCAAAAARRGTTVDADCSARPRDRLTTHFASAEARGTCVTNGDAPTILADLDYAVGWVGLVTPRPAGRSICTAERFAAAGRYATALLHIYAREHVHPTAPPNELPPRLVAVNQRYLDRCYATSSLADCGSGGDPCSALVLLDHLARIREEGRLFPRCGDNILAPGEECDVNDGPACPFSCNPDCTCPHCGDNRVNQPGEQCDGSASAACGSSPCQADCTCPPPVCGDNLVNQGSEQCDGTDSYECSGLCRADCTCPPPVCGNGVVESGEECDGVCFPYECGMPGGPEACRCCAVGSGVFVEDVGFYTPPCCDGSTCRVFGPHECSCDPSFCLPGGTPCGLQVSCCAGLVCNGVCG